MRKFVLLRLSIVTLVTQVVLKKQMLGSLATTFEDVAALMTNMPTEMRELQNMGSEVDERQDDSEKQLEGQTNELEEEEYVQDEPKFMKLDRSDSFAACLFIMDDNHFLVEWLAYHFTVLPLRRIIVTIDRKSSTDPREIFDRYKGLIKVTYMELEDFYKVSSSKKDYYKINIGNFTEKERDFHRLMAHRTRQNSFQSQCLEKLRLEGRNWVTNVDTDERIIINNQYQRNPLPDKHRTLVETLRDEENRKHSLLLNETCVVIPRYHFGPRDYYANASRLEDYPKGLGDFDLQTYRWRYRGTINKLSAPGKSIVDLSRCPRKWMWKTNAHKLVVGACQKQPVFGKGSTAPFIVNHYSGSWEQFSFRDDPRAETKSVGKFDEYKEMHTSHQDHNAFGWLPDFVNLVGIRKANILLRGAGQLWNKTLKPRGYLLEAAK